MTLFRTVEPAVEPVSVAEAKAQLRIGHDGEDELIGSLIAAARDEVERTTARALIAQSWRLSLDEWPRCGPVLLRRGPVTQILSITVFGGEGDADDARRVVEGLEVEGARDGGRARGAVRFRAGISGLGRGR